MGHLGHRRVLHPAPGARCRPPHVGRQKCALDLQVNPLGYKLWKNKATAYLTSKHPQIAKVLDWAEVQASVITAEAEKGAEEVLSGYDMEQVSGVLFVALQETLSDRLRMTKPQLAGAGRGLELWRILVKEFEAPDQPVVQMGTPEALGLSQPLQVRRGVAGHAASVGGLG